MPRTYGDKFGKGHGDYGKGYPVQQLPAAQTARYKDFSGGYYAGDSDEDVPPNTTPGGTDVEVTRKDRIIRAPGTAAFEALVGRSPEQLAIHAGLGYRSELILFDLPFIGFKREAATTWVNAGLVPGDPVTDMYFYATFGDDFLFQNGAQNVYKHTFGTDTVEIVNGVPLGHTMAVFAGRLWVGAGIQDGNFEPLGVDWSGVNGYNDRDIDNGAGQELIIQDTGLGDRLVALRPMGFDYMAMLFRRSIWIARRVDDLNRPADFVARVTGKGCVHERTAKTTFGGVIYLSDEGVELFDGNDSQHLSEAIDAEILPLDYANIHKYTATFNPQSQRYTLVVPGKAVYVYDALRKRWYKRTQLAIDVVPFATQFHSVTWAEMVGSWDAQALTWKGFAPNEIDTPDTVFLGQKVDTTYHIEKESQASAFYFDRPQVPLWICPVTEQEKDIGLITTQELRVTYVGTGTLGYQLRNNDGDLVHVSQAVFPVQAAPKTKKLTGIFTGKGVGLALEVGGSLEIVRAELDFRLRGKRIGDGVVDTGPPPAALPSNAPGRRAVLWTRSKLIHLSTTNLIGKAELGINNSGGNAFNGQGWIAAIKRYGRFQQANGNNPEYTQVSLHINPNPLVDPATPTRAVIVRIRDVVQLTRTAGATFGNIFFGYGDSYPFQWGTIEVIRGVGFHSYGGGTWRTYKSSNNMIAQRVFDTGIPLTNLCELLIELDGQLKQVRWYIDGVLVDTYNVVADAGPVNVNAQPGLYWYLQPNVGVSLQFNHGIGVGTIIELEAL